MFNFIIRKKVYIILIIFIGQFFTSSLLVLESNKLLSVIDAYTFLFIFLSYFISTFQNKLVHTFFSSVVLHSDLALKFFASSMNGNVIKSFMEMWFSILKMMRLYSSHTTSMKVQEKGSE